MRALKSPSIAVSDSAADDEPPQPRKAASVVRSAFLPRRASSSASYILPDIESGVASTPVRLSTLESTSTDDAFMKPSETTRPLRPRARSASRRWSAMHGTPAPSYGRMPRPSK